MNPSGFHFGNCTFVNNFTGNACSGRSVAVRVERGEIYIRNCRLSFFAFSCLFVNQHDVAGFSPALGDDHLAVGRPGETKNRLGGKIR